MSPVVRFHSFAGWKHGSQGPHVKTCWQDQTAERNRECFEITAMWYWSIPSVRARYVHVFGCFMCHWCAPEVSLIAVACCNQGTDSCLSLALTSPLKSHMVVMVMVVPTPQPVWSEPPSKPESNLICCCRTEQDRAQHAGLRTEKALLNLWTYWVLLHLAMTARNQSNIPRGTNKAGTNEVTLQMNCQQMLVRLMLTHVCHKFLSTATPIWPKALLLSFFFASISQFLVRLSCLHQSHWRSLRSFLCCKDGEILAGFPTGSLFSLLFDHESSDWRKPALNHSWQGGNQLNWSLLFFKGLRPF